MTTYICAIETGSFSAGANRTYERRSDNCVCGRAHRSYSAAQACMDRLRKASDATWLSAHIHDDDGHRAEPTVRQSAGRRETMTRQNTQPTMYVLCDINDDGTLRKFGPTSENAGLLDTYDWPQCQGTRAVLETTGGALLRVSRRDLFDAVGMQAHTDEPDSSR